MITLGQFIRDLLGYYALNEACWIKSIETKNDTIIITVLMADKSEDKIIINTAK